MLSRTKRVKKILDTLNFSFFVVLFFGGQFMQQNEESYIWNADQESWPELVKVEWKQIHRYKTTWTKFQQNPRQKFNFFSQWLLILNLKMKKTLGIGKWNSLNSD